MMSGALIRWLSSDRARLPVVLTALVLIPVVGWIDYAAEPIIQLDLFYVLPIGAVAWTCGRRVGLATAAYAALADVAVALIQSENSTTLAWNGIATFALFASVAVLVAAQRRLLDQQRQLASVDPLTQLLNRRSFRVAASREITRATRAHTPSTVVYIDIDNLKPLNDRYGHAEGDTAIAAVAAAAYNCTRATDLVARLGGDEFIVYLPATDLEEGEAFAKRFLNDLKSVAMDPPVSVSVGVLTDPNQALGVDALIERADAIMYEAKRRGGGAIQAVSL